MLCIFVLLKGCYNADNIKQMLHVIAQHNSRITDASQKIGTSFELEIPYPGVGMWSINSLCLLPSQRVLNSNLS